MADIVVASGDTPNWNSRMCTRHSTSFLNGVNIYMDHR